MRRRLMFAVLVFALLAAACSESEPEEATPPDDDTTEPDDAEPDEPDGDGENDSDDNGEPTEDDPDADPPDGGEDTAVPDPDSEFIIERYAGMDWFLGTIPSEPVAADDTLEPIKVGMINQEDTPAGSFPEMRFAADAAINWINAELGGVGGRPLELYPCVTQFSVESSQSCAQDLVLEEVVALVGGLDVLMQGALPVLEQNGIPIVGGIPAGLAEQQSEIAFFFSGGTSGGMAAFMQHAAENGAEKVFIAYGEFDSFTVAARDYGAKVAESLGMEVRLAPFPLIGADFTSVLNDARSFGADAVVMNAADTACVPLMKGFNDLGIEGSLYLFGACAAEAIIEAADGNQVGVVFNSEGPGTTEDVEGDIYNDVTDEYNNGPAKAAGTVGFRGMMNLYALMVELGPDNISSDSIMELVRSAVDRESFWGHPYTCDGDQVPGLPALCAPQQTLFQIPTEDAEDLTFISDWIDTPALFADAGVG